MPAETRDDPDEAPLSDPLADLLFTLIAAVLPAILLLAPLTETTRGEVARRTSERSAPVPPRGARSRPVVAGEDGLEIGGTAGPHVGLDRISDDPGLAAFLDELRRDGEGLSVIVEAGGLESAFLLEPVVAAHGLSTYDEMRLTTSCADAQEPARTACGRGP